MIILSASGFEPVYRGSDITVVSVTLVNGGIANHYAIQRPDMQVKRYAVRSRLETRHK